MNVSPSSLDRTQFLNLLVTQLQHQDPLNPLDQQQQLAQLAQFSTVEGIQSLNASFQDLLDLQVLGNGRNLLGATVEYQPDNTSAPQQGIVEQIVRQNGSLQIVVSGTPVPISQILGMNPDVAPAA